MKNAADQQNKQPHHHDMSYIAHFERPPLTGSLRKPKSLYFTTTSARPATTPSKTRSRL
jgi:hypothetical protein